MGGAQTFVGDPLGPESLSVTSRWPLSSTAGQIQGSLVQKLRSIRLPGKVRIGVRDGEPGGPSLLAGDSAFPQPSIHALILEPVTIALFGNSGYD